jgi:ATP-dependent helicase/nuclease subunit B
MTEPPVDPDAWLGQSVDGGAEVVTANRRLARDLITRYGEWQVRQGNRAWRTPPVTYWQDWLDRKLAAAADPDATPRRLDSASALVLWERCLAGRMPESVLGFAGIVHQAWQAWQRLSEWRVPLTAVLASARTQDEKLFAGAAADYADQLAAGDWVDSAGLGSVVADLLPTDPQLVPDQLVLAGFDRLAPAVEHVIAALRERDCEVTIRSAGDAAKRIEVASFEDEASELRAAGAWAAEKLAAHPGARVGVVCPELEADAVGVGRLVREGLVPGWQYGGESARHAVNVSYGRRLSDYPAIAAALLVLEWTVRGLPGRDLSVLLRSPFIGKRRAGDRARLELELRRHPDRQWTPSNFLAVTGSETAFSDIASEVDDAAARREDLLTPSECVEAIHGFLTAIGWPGDMALDSSSFQLVNRWRELLNEFSRVAGVLAEMPFAEAISRLTAMARETIWQPEGDPGVVQVLGVLEAAGLTFDHLWVTGMDATRWPPASRPSAFLPRSLQIEYGMPDATPVASLAHAQLVMQRLVASTRECVFSWPRSLDDAELTPSALLDQWGGDAYDGPEDPGWTVGKVVSAATMGQLEDDDAPPVGGDEHVRGGAYTIQRQCTEPFRAFAEGRLGVTAPEPFRTGLAPSVRGNLIHNALHNLLSDRPDQGQVAAWTPAQRSQRIGTAVDSALASHQRHADEVTARILAIERSRLRLLLDAFLEAETERRPFEILGLESSLAYEHAGVELSLRVDRIDRLADGRLLVVDYKTGQPKRFATRSGELKDVQLVVYADAIDGDIGALAFVNVDSRQIAWQAAGGAWNPDEENDWAARLAGWRDEVREATRRLARGDARINVLQSAEESRSHAILSRAEECKRGNG